MQLTINDKPQTFSPIQTFRSRWNLPDEFQIDYFEPKDWEGLGSMKGAGDALAQMKQEVLATIPEVVTPLNVLSAVDILRTSFRYQMEMANEQMGLRHHDVGFAVAGFEDVMRNAVYELLRLNTFHQNDLAQVRQNFDFPAIYQAWLDTSARLSSTVHTYRHGSNEFKVRIVNHIYGRVGLEVKINGEVYYVTDKALACPGESYMWELCQEVAQVLCNRLGK